MTSGMDELPFTPTSAGICEAARAGDVAAIDLLLAETPELLVADNPHNWSKTVARHEIRGSHSKKPVEVAAFFNQPEAVAKLLEISRDSVAIKGPFSDFLPFAGHYNSLRIAVAMNHPDVIRAIEDDVMARLYVCPNLLELADDDGRTVLHYAAEQGDIPLVRVLLKRGANVDSPQKSGRRVIHAVLDCGNDREYRDVAHLLIEGGADYDLWVATALDDVNRVKQLLSERSPLTNKNYRPDCDGLSEGFPLVRACANGNRTIVELLLDHGADVNADVGGEDRAEFGMPLIAAVYARHFDIAQVLLDRGASLDAHPNCASPLVDMLYHASVEVGPDWLALGELKYATDDPRSHLQANDSGSPAVVALYQRVLSLGGKPQMYSHVIVKNYDEIERLLRDEPEAIVSTFGGPDTVFNSLSQAAAWLGNAKTMELCLTLQPQLHSPEAANDHIRSAISSHNRDGSFADYHHIVELNLRHLKAHGAPVTVDPLCRLACDFFENYNYGANPKLPTMDDLLTLAVLFLAYGVNVNQRRNGTGRTALAEAVDAGHVEYVEFLLNHSAEIPKEDPPETNPVLLARKHGFAKILELLGEPLGPWGEVVRSDMIPLVPPDAGQPPHFMTPLNNTVIRLGVAQIHESFQPKGDVNDTHAQFFEFPEPFPEDQLDNVRLIITNRDNPQIVGSATTGLQKGVQGFLLTARNSVRADTMPDGRAVVVEGVSFSWMAVLPTDQPQERRYTVRYGLIPFREYREFPGQLSFTFPETDTLYADEPMDDAGPRKFVFLTTTVSGAANAAAADATEQGIPAITAHQTGHDQGGARLHWMVIAEKTASYRRSATSATQQFSSDDLWIHTARGEPKNLRSREWQHHWMKFPCPFRERSPCVFVTSNRHRVEGHHASAVAMSWHCKRDSYVVKLRSFDPLRGRCNFDSIAIGHCEVPATQVAETNQRGISPIAPWERFIESEYNGYELAATGQLGVNEFGEHGGSLLFHSIYHEYQIATLRQLLALGADVNQQQPVTHARPLHIAATYGRLRIAQLLIQRGADVNAPTVPQTESPFPPRWKLTNQFRPYRGETALHLAMIYRNFDVARLLLDAGADPNAEDCDGDRPIDYLPEWHTYPDNLTHWRLINHRTPATKQDYFNILDWMLEEEARYADG